MTLTALYSAYAHAHGNTPQQQYESDGGQIHYAYLRWACSQRNDFFAIHGVAQPEWFDKRSTNRAAFTTPDGEQALGEFVLARYPSVRGATR